jgi:hypothetical protein
MTLEHGSRATQDSDLSAEEAIRLFSDYLRVTGVAHIGPQPSGDPRLIGKRLGLLNGSSWITLWANYFGHIYLPGVHLVNAGNEAVQINFMEAHSSGTPTIPEANLSAFKRYAIDLVELGHVDMVLITCSTMSRAYPQVKEALRPYGVPVFQIDRSMMERAVNHADKILVIASHGPTVASTQALLQDVAIETGHSVSMIGALVEEAWNRLARGEVEAHNDILAKTIRDYMQAKEINCVVLAQLSMTVFLLSYPNPLKEFGIPVYTSGQCGFEAVRDAFLLKT